MPRPDRKSSTNMTEKLLGEASWLISHAQALVDYGRPQEAALEWARAATCEERLACLLEADGQDREAAIHRVSAASCHERLGQWVQAVTLLRAALSGPLSDDYRARVESQRTRCLTEARKELSRTALVPMARAPAAVSDQSS